MTNGRLVNGMPTWWLLSGPESPSVAGRNLSWPPIFVHSFWPSCRKAPVVYAVGVNVVPRE
jgi:hypothetical protein